MVAAAKNGGHHDGGGARQRGGEPLQRRDGAAARAQAGESASGAELEAGCEERRSSMAMKQKTARTQEESKGGEKSGIDGEDGRRQDHEKREHGEVDVVALALHVEELDAHSEQGQMDGWGDEVAAGEEKEIDEEKQEVNDSKPGGDAAGNDEGTVTQKEMASQNEGAEDETTLMRSSLPVEARVANPVTTSEKERDLEEMLDLRDGADAGCRGARGHRETKYRGVRSELQAGRTGVRVFAQRRR